MLTYTTTTRVSPLSFFPFLFRKYQLSQQCNSTLGTVNLKLARRWWHLYML